MNKLLPVTEDQTIHGSYSGSKIVLLVGFENERDI